MFLFTVRRCEDANLVDVPVLIGRTGLSFYRLAFFSKWAIDAGEELTWDYNLSFNPESDEELQPFECKCQSDWCRDPTRAV